MAKKVTPVDFECCITSIAFAPSQNCVKVNKSHYDKNGATLSKSEVEISLTSNTFETAMQIATAIASNVGLVKYEE